jgi:ELWxxDGT repeat protein
LYFSGYRTGEGAELWRTDGTPAGTVLVQDIRPGLAGSSPYYFTPLGDELYFNADDGVHGMAPWRYTTGAPAVTVTGRRVFYNHSTFDGRDPAATLADLAAVAPDKAALLPGQNWSFANVTSYSRGINGVLIEFAGMPPQTLTAEDFGFNVRGGRPTDSWRPAPPATVTALASPLGANIARYAITWPDGAIRNSWLEVTVKAEERTGLSIPDVFYFGNLVGESGDGSSPTAITSRDVLDTRRALGSSSDLTGRFDFDRSGRVTASDLLIVRGAVGRSLAGPFDRSTVAEFPATPWDRRAAAIRRFMYNPLLA